MEEAKKELFGKYINWIYTSSKSYEYIGRYIKIVKSFLESGSPVNRTGYRRFMQSNAVEIAEEPLTKSALLEFLSFNGTGYRALKKKIEINPLEKLSVISEKNRKLMNDFIYYLTQEEDYSPHTISLYSFSIKKYFEYANEISFDNYKRFIHTLEEQAFDNYKRFIHTLEEQGMSPATIRLRITAIERLSEFAGKPIKLKRPKFKRKLDTDNVPTEQEYERLLEFLRTKKNQDYYFFIKVLAVTGARVSEFLQFTWEDILRGEVTLRGKGNKYRRFFFPKSLQTEVRKYVEESGKTGLFAKGKYGGITDRGLSQNMKNWGKACGIDPKKMHPHAFRHFFAKMFLKRNKDVIQLADLLGHGSIDTTRIYLQKSYDEQKKEFNRSVTW